MVVSTPKTKRRLTETPHVLIQSASGEGRRLPQNIIKPRAHWFKLQNSKVNVLLHPQPRHEGKPMGLSFDQAACLARS